VVPAVHSETALMRKARRLRTAWHNVTGLQVDTNKGFLWMHISQ
jgi:hypothetical protein